ncbi:hypothetical protein BDZ91DRAFT_747340 [Kalaharituber pfeilii]|nr:hypothetical protein BDZ91DRAFT_747340 [Kalaharituber pfeilii]
MIFLKTRGSKSQSTHMAAVNPILLLNNLILVPDALQLGRFVRSIEQPHQDFCSVLDSAIPPTAVIDNTLSDFQAATKHSSSSSFLAKLTKLFSSTFSNENTTSLDLSAKILRTYQLKNSRTWFYEALKHREAKEWIENAIRDGVNAYFIVGYHTVQELKVCHQGENKGIVAGGVSLEPNMALGLGVVPDTLNATVSGTKKDEHSGKLSFTAGTSSEHAFGIQYRKLKFRWFSSKTVEQAKLEEGNSWKVLWNLRGSKKDEDDVVEVEFDEGDDGEGGLGDWKKQVLENGFCYVFQEDDGSGEDEQEEDEEDMYEDEEQ